MKIYHIIILILKIMIVVQFLLVLIQKHSIDSKVYLFTEIIFKISLALYIQYLIFTSTIIGFEWEDKVVISFAGGLLLYDAIIHTLPLLLAKYNIEYSIQFNMA